MEVDDHVPGFAAAVEQLVHRRHGLHGPLQRPDRECSAAGEDERAHRAAAVGAHSTAEQQPEGAEHEDPAADDQRCVHCGRFLGLLRRQAPADDEAALVEAEIEHEP